MDDDESQWDESQDDDSQWSDEAREAYLTAARRLQEALNDHVTLVSGQVGGAAEAGPYITSALTLQAAAAEFSEAEFEWCGSFPLALASEDEDDDSADDEEAASGPIISLVGRWDVRLDDAEAFVDHARAVYREDYPEHTTDDAASMVADAPGALLHLTHSLGIEALYGTIPGITFTADLQLAVQHDDPESIERDPFDIVQ